ncbi:hypothetical protein JIG36_29380 [Actinoplanes sp. LDG1-06]|uniref:HTH luxR-type domain-containing protein n=1 Tax=Paractinoplanes ovalisporus TaxID=2810368 RepID=A0ABS2AIJ1_9ACTN|nr:LuxR C-terminal-related transcriptional regulator [Actinoplanes ovalisporus]MBM2619662.1 hypothetical protein [Actinoplanes ovalisporus]
MPQARTVHGRDELLSALRRAPVAEGALTFLHGPRGAGRTTLLRATARAARSDGTAVIDVRLGEERSVLAALRPHLGDRPETADTTGDVVRTALRLGAAIDRLAGGRPLVLLVDDADTAADAALVLDAARRRDVLVVATGTTGSGLGDQLAVLADTVLEVPPLDRDARAAMIGDHHGAEPDESLDTALDHGLGALAGGPAAVLDACAALARAGRLVTLDDRLCLARPRLPLPVTSATTRLLCDRLDDPARALLTEVAVNPVQPAELAAHPGRGRLADRLAEAGVLGQDDEGRLRCSSPAVAAHLLSRLGPGVAAGRRRALAASMLAARRDGADLDPAALGDRIARYRGLPAPGDEAMRLLLTLIARPGTEPDRRAEWIRAAWERAMDAHLRPRLAAGWLRELTRAGRAGDLAAAVDAVLATGPAGPELLGDLAAAAMLAAVHTGVPVPETTRDRLLVGGRAPAALEFARRWFAGEPAVGDGLDKWPDAGLVTAAELAAAARFEAAQTYPGDWASAFESVLGPRYRCASESLPGAYRRVLQGYRDGDFDAALTAARETELIGTGDTPAHRLSRVWAAEMSRLRGAAREIGPESDPALLVWAGCGPVELAPPDLASALGAYGKIEAPSPRGAALLVPRLAQLAVRGGEPATARRLLDDLADRCDRETHPALGEALQLTRAVVTGDPIAAASAMALARERDDRPALLRACLVAGDGFLVEAYEIARDLGAAPLQAWVATAMRRNGVSVPAAVRASDGFSPLDRRILRMISAGRTNRQIGRRERLSEKTVEEHVSRLLARTGTRSRVQLATAVLAGRVSNGDTPPGVAG